MWIGVQIAAYASLVLGYLLLLVLVVRHRIERGRTPRLLEASLLLAAVWTVFLGLVQVSTSGYRWEYVWQRTAQAGLIVLALVTVEFAEAFVQRPSRRSLRLGLVALLSVAAILIDALSVRLPLSLSPLDVIQVGNRELGSLLLVIAWACGTSAAWWSAITAMRQATGSRHRNRIRYLLGALATFVVGDLIILIGGTLAVYVGLLARLVGYGLVTFAIMRHRLPDIRRWTLVAVRLLLLVGLTAAVYLVAVLIAALASGAFPDRQSLLMAWPAVVVGLLLAATLDVVLGPGLQRWLDRSIMGYDYDVQKGLRTYGQQVNLILDLERLADTTLEWLQTTVRVRRAAFILLTPQGHRHVELRVLRATNGQPVPAPKSFGMDGRFLIHFYRQGRPLSQYDVDMLTWFQGMPGDERQWLKELTLDLYIPVLVADRPVALLALGPKAGEQPYSDNDLEALMILAGQTGTALENARLVDDLRAVQEDLHRLSNELSETNRQLSRLDQAKSDFIAIASHELRTPLTQIYGYSDILAKLDGDDLGDTQVVHEFVQGISRGAERLRQVVDAMVDVSLIETGSLRVRPAAVTLDAIVEKAMQTIRPALRERSLALEVADLSDLPFIQADGSRLEQVFVSLLSNAVKYTPDGGRITVTGYHAQSSPDDDFVEVLVSDTGIGVDPDHRDLIFVKFHRAENPMLHSTDSVRFKGAGPGLGLVIAKGIVDAHGGKIWVESPGRDEQACPGSVFHVRLPVGTPELE